MSEDQFENYCNGLVDLGTSSNVLKLLKSNLKILAELKDKQKLLKQETHKLQLDMDAFRYSMQKKFQECLDKNADKFTKNIAGYVRRHALDDNNDVLKFNQTKLPEPLRPSASAP